MASFIIKEALHITYSYLQSICNQKDLHKLCKELKRLANSVDVKFEKSARSDVNSYETVQSILSSLNEKETIRKNKGVYYTPQDVVKFIVYNCMKSVSGALRPDNIQLLNIDGIPYQSFCFKTIYDPACGAGEFLLASLTIKMDLMDANTPTRTAETIKKIVKTIKGNDVNLDSVIITKLRLFLCIFHRYGIKLCVGLAGIINASFTHYDFVTTTPCQNKKFDIIIGNPPYVEDNKSGLILGTKYGNIYANVLKNAALHLKPNGSMGFVIPLSYVATPRMKKIRRELLGLVPEQYLLSYSDRPDCLFSSVHQKLCIMIGGNRGAKPVVYTSSYQYWYKGERDKLFDASAVIQNSFVENYFIPKIGNQMENSIYKKVTGDDAARTSIGALCGHGEYSVYCNMRATFWIKAFLNAHKGSEYKRLCVKSQNVANYLFCLLNSSLFWWFWICISDCWHITNKELSRFMVPDLAHYDEMARLAATLERKLEETKSYVGTKQTDYEYKHKMCVEEIHQIDDIINDLFGLTEEESLYVKNFAFRYRISGGVKDAEKI